MGLVTTRGVYDLLSVKSFGDSPCGYYVVQHALCETQRDLVVLHKVSHAGQHFVVLLGGGVHLLEDCGDVAEDGGVEEG